MGKKCLHDSLSDRRKASACPRARSASPEPGFQYDPVRRFPVLVEVDGYPIQCDLGGFVDRMPPHQTIPLDCVHYIPGAGPVHIGFDHVGASHPCIEFEESAVFAFLPEKSGAMRIVNAYQGWQGISVCRLEPAPPPPKVHRIRRWLRQKVGLSNCSFQRTIRPLCPNFHRGAQWPGD